MPNIFFDNFHLWQKQTDVDYFTYFMKSWLVVNAWMYHSTGSEKDRENIDYVKEHSNTFKNKITFFLKGTDIESSSFREHLGNLHVSLQRASLKNKSELLEFENAFIGVNPLRLETKLHRGCEYKVEFTSANNYNHVVTIDCRSSRIFNANFNRYDIFLLESHSDFSTLTQERKTYIRECYKIVNPKLYRNLLTIDKENSIKCGTVNFVNDADLVSKALIEMIYRLRCILFHGELVPNKEAQKAYEHSYFILKMVIDRLG